MAMNAVSTANHNNSNNNPNITTISLATTTIAAAGGMQPTPPPPPPPSILSATVKRPLPPPPPAKRTSSNNNKERYHPGLEVEHALASYLRQSVDSFDLTKNTEVFVLLLFSFIAFGLYYFNSFFCCCYFAGRLQSNLGHFVRLSLPPVLWRACQIYQGLGQTRMVPCQSSKLNPNWTR